MKKGMTNRKKQALATKRRIYNVGIKLIRKHGIDGTNVTRIAKEAGVSVGTFYHYYTSKLDLFMDLYRSADDYYETGLADLIRDLNFEDKVQVFFEKYAAMAESNGIGLTQKMYIPENTLFLARDRGMHSVLRDIVREAQESGCCIREKTPEDIEGDLFLVARGVIFDWALHEGSYDMYSKMKEMLQLYIDSIISKETA